MTIQSHINFWLILCLLMLLSFVSIVHAEPIELKDDNSTPLTLTPHYQLHIDDQHKLSIDDVLSPKSQIKFSPITDQNYKFKFHQETLWFKVDVNHTNAYDSKRLLEFNFPLINDLGVYIVHTHSKRILARFDGNNDQSFNNRLYQHSNFIFPITLPAKAELTFYFRIKSDRYTQADATLWQPNAFVKHDRLTYFLVCLYLGLLISLICYSLFLFMLIRDNHYIFYAIFSSAMLLAVGSYQGIWFELFWPNMPHWQMISIPISFAVAGLFAVLFSRSFLQTKSDAPILDKVLVYISIAFVLILCASPFISNTMSIQVVALCTLVFICIAFITAIVLSIKDNRRSRIYLISWLVFLVCVALFSAQILSWLPTNFWTHNSIIYASTLEMFVLFFTLAQKMAFLNTENNRSRQEIFKTQNKLITTLRNNDRELFNLVKKRTISLEKANEYLASQHGNMYDTLTGLANATLITEQLQLLLTTCKHKQTKLAILLLNINNFKDINTQFGHEIGDKLLISIAAKIRDNLHETDIAARTKGDEFIILLDINNTDNDPKQLSRKLKKVIAQTIIIDGYAIQASVSIGTAIYPDNGDDADDLLSKATQFMYIDKGYAKSFDETLTSQ